MAVPEQTVLRCSPHDVRAIKASWRRRASTQHTAMVRSMLVGHVLQYSIAREGQMHVGCQCRVKMLNMNLLIDRLIQFAVGGPLGSSQVSQVVDGHSGALNVITDGEVVQPSETEAREMLVCVCPVASHPLGLFCEVSKRRSYIAV